MVWLIQPIKRKRCMKTKIISILLLLFCAAMSVKSQTTINYVHVKTVYADGRETGPIGFNNNCPFIFEGERIYQYSKPSFVMGDGSDGFRLYSIENGKAIYFYYCSGTSGLVQQYRNSQPYWKFDTAIIVSADRQTINMCYYDNSGNLKSTSVYKVPSAPGASGFID